ncbi:MAG: type II secretion system protein GspM [Deltaproteobacteria bacterium]|nr:type II secretion system protein GspM [Deltaproteobacteria bacterium]
MMFRLKLDRKRKRLLIAGAVLLCLGAGYRFFPTFKDMFFPEAEIDIKEQRILKLHKRIQADSGLATELQDLKGALKTAESGLLKGKTPALTAVQVQEIIQQITEKSGAVVQRLNVLKPEPSKKGGYLSIPVEFHMYATINQLKDVLYRIGVFEKYLIVKNLRIDYMRRKAGGSIRCQITVAGYMKKAEA